MKAKIVEGSESGHDCCFSHTVVDETKPLPGFPFKEYIDGMDPVERFVAICECHSFEDTLKVMKALNEHQKIYVVIGDTGEYDDFSTWIVKAYFSKALADSHALQAQTAADKLQRNNYEPVNPYDPFMKLDYNGAHYRVQEIDFYGGDL